MTTLLGRDIQKKEKKKSNVFLIFKKKKKKKAYEAVLQCGIYRCHSTAMCITEFQDIKTWIQSWLYHLLAMGLQKIA